MTPPVHYRLAPEVLSQKLNDELVLLNLQTGVYFQLNGTGTRICQLLVETGDLGATVAQMQSEYEASAEELVRDVDALLSDLLNRGLLQQEPQR